MSGRMVAMVMFVGVAMEENGRDSVGRGGERGRRGGQPLGHQLFKGGMSRYLEAVKLAYDVLISRFWKPLNKYVCI